MIARTAFFIAQYGIGLVMALLALANDDPLYWIASAGFFIAARIDS